MTSEGNGTFFDTLPKLPVRPKDGHKGTFGTAALIGGSAEMTGAIRLAGRAALRAGAGLVRLMVPEPAAAAVIAETPEYMTVRLPADRRGRISFDAEKTIRARLTSADAFGVGPGMGRSLGLELLTTGLFFASSNAAPSNAADGAGVFDADALNALAAREVFLPPERRRLFEPFVPSWPGVRILTPHPGEFARLRGLPTPSDSEGRQKAAVEFVRDVRALYGWSPLILVLKGAGTIVTDSERVFVNETGNPGMATGGSGDVLTGLLTALLARRLDPFDAATLAVALHGLAGDLAAERLGFDALTAGALLDFLPLAFQRLEREGAS